MGPMGKPRTARFLSSSSIARVAFVSLLFGFDKGTLNLKGAKGYFPGT